VVPFTDRADPVGVGLGVLALELLLASALSVLIQRRLGFHRWRALHSLGYLAFTMVAAHLLISGAEVAPAPVRTAIAAAWAAVVVAGVSTVAPVARMPRAVLDTLSRRHRAEEITVAVDPGKCGSFGFCEQEAPAIFTLRSDQRLAYRSVVPSEQAEAAMRAAMVCPARAIKLGRLPATVVVSQPTAETSTISPLAASLSPAPSPHTGSHTGSLAGLDPAGPHTGRQPAATAAAPHTGRQPATTAAAPHTGPLPSVRTATAGTAPHTGALPSVRTAPPAAATGQAPHTGPLPSVRPAGTGTGQAPHTGPLPSVRPASGPHTGSLPGLRPVPASGAAETGPHPGSGPPTGARPGVVGPHTGPLPAPAAERPAQRPAERPAEGRRPTGARNQNGPVFRPAAVAVPRRAGAADPPPPVDPLPPPSDLQDTGRHHLPALRGIAGGRS
jgi:ferredoxin